MHRKDLQRWERIETRLIVDRPYCKLVEDRVRLPSGEHATWWRFADDDEGACVICQDQNRVLITYQYNNAPQRVVDEFPIGVVEAGELPIDTARRELLEEVGIYANTLTELGSFLVNNRRSAKKVWVFLATQLEQRIAQPESTECIAQEWVSIPEVDQRIRTSQLENGILLAAWCIFCAYRATGA